jgi:hypothetical protein
MTPSRNSVFAEAARRLRPTNLMGRRDNPHIHRSYHCRQCDNAPSRTRSSFTCMSKSACRRSHPEEGSAICLFETAYTAHCCSRERPLHARKVGLDSRPVSPRADATNGLSARSLIA